MTFHEEKQRMEAQMQPYPLYTFYAYDTVLQGRVDSLEKKVVELLGVIKKLENYLNIELKTPEMTIPVSVYVKKLYADKVKVDYTIK